MQFSMHYRERHLHQTVLFNPRRNCGPRPSPVAKRNIRKKTAWIVSVCQNY